MNQDQPLRDHLAALLRGGQAYDTFENIVDSFDTDTHAATASGIEHSAWQILDHLRIALRDILDYCQNESDNYQPKSWPEDYWQKSPAPPSAESWNQARAQYLADRTRLINLILDPNHDLFAPFPWSKGEAHTLLREALLAADHAAYHLGQLVVLREALNVA